MALRIGTRRSMLAMAQTRMVADTIAAANDGLTVELVPIVTKGDSNPEVPIDQLGTKELWTAELTEALDQQRIDIAVHSAKDLPATLPDGHVVACTPRRFDPADALICDVAATIDDLPQGAIIGTSSLRRAAQLLAIRPDLKPQPIRGNVETRIKKVRRGDYQATLLAIAGLQRANLQSEAASIISTDVMLPAPGQAVLAIEAVADRTDVAEILAPIHHQPTAAALAAERLLVTTLGVGCRAPLAALATVSNDQVTLKALLATPDASRIARTTQTASTSEIDTLVDAAVADLNAQDAQQILASLD